MRIAFIPGYSTFALRQIAGLLDMGHSVQVYEYAHPQLLHPEVDKYDLLRRTRWLSRVASLRGPYLPLSLLLAPPKALRALLVAPRLTIDTLTPPEVRQPKFNLRHIYALHHLDSLLQYRDDFYDIVHCHFTRVCYAAHFTKRMWGAKFLATYHSLDSKYIPRFGPRLFTRVFEIADGITVNSDALKRELVARGCPPGKVFKLPPGLDVGQFRFRDRQTQGEQKVKLLTVARLVKEKGLEYAIGAVGQAVQHYPRIQYDIVGDGPLRPRLASLVRALHLENVVNLLGSRPNSAVRQLMDDADIFLSASTQEALGVALLEAQACGLPVVATAVGGVPEAVADGKSAFLVSPGEADALADRLIYLLQHSELWPEMGLAGRKHVEKHFDMPQLNRRLVEIYQTLLAENNAADRALSHVSS